MVDARRLAFSPGKFAPAWWLPGGHAQTVYGGRLRPVPPLTLRTEQWLMGDGQPVRVDVADARDANAPSLVVLHGLESACDAANVRGMLKVGTARGWAAFAPSFRGCSGVPLQVTKSYHAGYIDDLEDVLLKVSELRPRAPIVLVGISLGGNVTLKMLGSSARLPSSLKAACTVSSPFRLQACTAALDGFDPMVRIYRTLFLRDIRAKVRHYRAAFPGRLGNVDHTMITSFTSFDQHISTRATGSASVEEYWANHSSERFLPAIRIPVLLINADDDPLVPGATIPIDVIADQPLLHLSRHARGGHVAFIAGGPAAPRFFAEEEAGRFFDQVLAL